MKYKDYYDTLGVDRSATDKDIKLAYRRLARKLHPDVSREADAELRFKEMKEAYEVLHDPEKRAAYDRFGSEWQNGQDFQPPPGWRQAPGGHSGRFEEAGEFSDFFQALFGGGMGGGAHMRMPGEDIEATVKIALEDAFRGATRALTLNVPQADASGRVREVRRTLSVRIPKGVTAGQRIRLEGQGRPGHGGPGDLFLRVAFAPHPQFRAEGKDVYLTLPVAPWEAALGRRITVPTLGGDVDVTVPAGAGSGRKLRLRGRGLPGKTPGDQYVVIQIVTPKATTPRQRELYEELERESGFDPRA